MTRNFRSLYDQGFVRVAAASPRTTVGDPKANADEILRIARELSEQGVGVAVFPELCLAGYGLDDLLSTDVLLAACLAELKRLTAATKDLLPAIVIGLPMRVRGLVCSCAAVLHRGEMVTIAPGSTTISGQPLPPREPNSGWHIDSAVDVFDREIEFDPGVIVDTELDGLSLHVEVGADARLPQPPSAVAASAGATLLIHIDSSPAAIGRANERRSFVQAASKRNAAACVYANAGAGGSTTDYSWDGQTLICEAGRVLAAGELFAADSTYTIADVDLDLLRNERARRGGFAFERPEMQMNLELNPPREDFGLRRELERFPFVPSSAADLDRDCQEAFDIQIFALNQRLAEIGQPKIVIGVSGGLDSTHALLVAAKAMDAAGRPRSDILAFTMPGFATTDHTRSNAEELALALGCTFQTLDIRPTASLFLETIGHAPDVYDVTYENVQAGLRTDYLFRIANQRGGIVLGTGDLSELALGWCTYGVGDQMSHYGVNAGIPKTLMQHLIRWTISSGQFDEQTSAVLDSILNTEVTPELVPTTGDEKPQTTEGSIGPYNLHDFFLYWTLRHGMRPSKIAFLAEHAWSDAAVGTWPAGFPEASKVQYDPAEISQWLRVFGKRFYTQQFKRSAMPNGPQVSAAGSLSPRVGWQMPSDANANAFLAELDELAD